jgi:hypothetical protein
MQIGGDVCVVYVLSFRLPQRTVVASGGEATRRQPGNVAPSLSRAAVVVLAGHTAVELRCCVRRRPISSADGPDRLPGHLRRNPLDRHVGRRSAHAPPGGTMMEAPIRVMSCCFGRSYAEPAASLPRRPDVAVCRSPIPLAEDANRRRGVMTSRSGWRVFARDIGAPMGRRRDGYDR